MALGDVKTTMQPTPIYVWRKKASGYASPTKGDPVSFDSAGDLVLGVDTADPGYGMLTGLTTLAGGSTTYYQVLIWGMAVMTMGGAVKPNKLVTIDSSSKLIQYVATLSATYVQAEQKLANRKFGTYICLESDLAATGIFAASDAADTNLGVVFVGKT